MGRQKRRIDELRGFVVPRAKQFVVPKAKLVKKSVSSRSFFYNAVKVVGLVLFYYSFSITLTFYNKKFIRVFKFPLSITLVHLVTKFLLASIVRSVLSCKREPRTVLQWGPYFKRIAPPGIASCIDIGLSNWGLEFVTISLYTMTKSTAIVFIMAFSILFGLEKPRCSLVAVVLCIATGLFMFTFKSVQFNLLGFLLVLGASFTTGIRWTLSQVVLQKAEMGLSNPVDMMYHIQPWMILTLLPLAAIFEGVHVATSEQTFGYHDTKVMLEHALILMAGALLAFMLELSEFLLVRTTNSLTLSISGIIKEIFTLLLASPLEGDQMNFLNGIGLVICLAGIALHIILRAVYAEETVQEKSKSKHTAEAIELLQEGTEDETVLWQHDGSHRNRHRDTPS